MTTTSEFDQVPFDEVCPHAEQKQQIYELQYKLDRAEESWREQFGRAYDAVIRARVAESLLEDCRQENARLRVLADRSWKQRLLDEVIASGRRILNRRRYRWLRR